MSDEEKIQIAALGLLGILGRKPKRRPKSPQRKPSPQRSPSPQDSDNDEDGQPRKRRGTLDLLYSGIPSGIPTPDETDRERAERQEAERQQKNRERKAKVEAYREAFSKYDTDRSGSISLSELAEGYRLAGMGFEAAREAMGEHDLDRNGSLSFDEFLGWGLDTNALEQWGEKFKRARIANDTAEAVKPTEPIVKPKTRRNKLRTKDYDNMVSDYLIENVLMTTSKKYTRLTGDNIKDWKAAVKYFDQTPRKMGLIHLYRGFLNAATRRDKGKDIYGKDQLTTVFAGDQETAEAKFGKFVEPFLKKYDTKTGDTITKVPSSAGELVKLLDSLIDAWGEDVYKAGRHIKRKNEEIPTKGKRDIARGGDSSSESEGEGDSDDDSGSDDDAGGSDSSSEDDEEDGAGGSDSDSGSSSDEDDNSSRSSSPSSSDDGSEDDEDDDEEDGADRDNAKAMFHDIDAQLGSGSADESSEGEGGDDGSGSESDEDEDDDEEGDDRDNAKAMFHDIDEQLGSGSADESSEDGDKTPEQGTTDSSSRSSIPSSSSDDEAEEEEEEDGISADGTTAESDIVDMGNFPRGVKKALMSKAGETKEKGKRYKFTVNGKTYKLLKFRNPNDNSGIKRTGPNKEYEDWKPEAETKPDTFESQEYFQPRLRF